MVDIYSDPSFYSPFGPKFFEARLVEETRLDLLEFVDINKKLEIGTDIPAFLQPWSGGITKGDLRHISKKEDEAQKGIIGKTIDKLLSSYIMNFMDISDKDELDNEIEYNVNSCWSLILGYGDFVKYHWHDGHALDMEFGYVSGVMYLKAENDEETNAPEGNFTWYSPYKFEKINKHIKEIHPQTGNIFVWPSWVPYSINPTRNHKNQHTMIFFKGSWDAISKKPQEEFMKWKTQKNMEIL